MIERITEKAYAKINLHLDVTGILDGGYHAVSTVMQSVSVFDEITLSEIRPAPTPSFKISCDLSGVPCDEKNLAYRAAVLFCENVGVSLSAKIDIVKNIPMAAGMAGGSTDGAAVLRGLNKALGEPLTLSELCAIGSRLGADVPFCTVGGTLYADGKGDLLHSFPKMPDCHIVIACEGEGVSTPWAYRLLDETHGNFEAGAYEPKDVTPLKNALSEGNISEAAGNIYNIFEAPVLALRPIAADIKDTLLLSGATAAMMSGSGPSVFGIFEAEQDAIAAAGVLKEKGYRPHLCRPVSTN